MRRRHLIEALYDLIIIQIVHEKYMLNDTVELTESRIGNNNLVFINFGENGIRIGDLSRQQVHPQLGVCPSW